MESQLKTRFIPMAYFLLFKLHQVWVCKDKKITSTEKQVLYDYRQHELQLELSAS